jgi:type 1 fimbria pilin
MEIIIKKIIIVALASTAFMSSAAFAQSNTDSADLVVSGTVQQECSIADPAAVNFPVVNINEGAGATALLLRNGSQHTTQNIYVSCNYGATLSAESANGGLLNAAGASLAQNDSNDFTNLIHYRVKLTATDSSFPELDFRTRLEASDSQLAGGAFHNNATLEVRIDRDDTQKRPVAGAYTDTTTLTIGVI